MDSETTAQLARLIRSQRVAALGTLRGGAPLTCTCEATPRILARSSFWKPFITESTTISAATPSAMPAIEMAEMKLMKWLRRLARV